MNECIEDMKIYLEETAEIIGIKYSKLELEALSNLFIGILLTYKSIRFELLELTNKMFQLIGTGDTKILN